MAIQPIPTWQERVQAEHEKRRAMFQAGVDRLRSAGKHEKADKLVEFMTKWRIVK